MKVFLSYARSDRERAEQLRNALLSWGLDPWMDVHDIPPGVYWPDEIDHALNSADVVVGFLSAAAVKSRSVKNEWDWCIVYGKRLLLVRCEATYVPMNYVSINFIDSVDDEPGALAALRSALSQRSDVPSRTPDRYYDYLAALYERVNTYLAERLVLAIGNKTSPEPLRLQARAEPGAVELLFGRHRTLDPLFVAAGAPGEQTADVFDDVWQAWTQYGGRVVLLGHPGAGKSFTLLHFCRDAVVRRLQDPSLPLPVLGIISTWDIEQQPPVAEWLADSYGAPDDVTGLIARGDAVLLLDGLDELGSPRKGQDPKAAFIDALPANNQLMISCRRHDYETIGRRVKAGGAVTLLPLTDAQIRDVAGVTPQLRNVLAVSAKTLDRFRTPLLLSLLADAARDSSVVEFLEAEASQTDITDRMCKRFVRNRFDHEITRRRYSGAASPQYSLDDVYEVMGHACMNVVSHNTAFGEATIPSWLIESGYQHLVLRVRKGEWTSDEGYAALREAAAFIELVRSLNLITKVGVRMDRDIFAPIHALFLQHFAVSYSITHAADVLLYTDIVSTKPTHIIRRFGDRRAVAALIDAMKSSNIYLQFSAAEALGELMVTEAVPALIEALETRNGLLKIAAADALGAMKAELAVEELVRHLDDYDDGYFRLVSNAALDALEKIGTPRALRAVRSARRRGLVRDDPIWDW